MQSTYQDHPSSFILAWDRQRTIKLCSIVTLAELMIILHFKEKYTIFLHFLYICVDCLIYFFGFSYIFFVMSSLIRLICL